MHLAGDIARLIHLADSAVQTAQSRCPLPISLARRSCPSPFNSPATHPKRPAPPALYLLAHSFPDSVESPHPTP